MEDKKCNVVSSDIPLDASYWESQYKAKGWDLGTVSPPIKAYIETLAKQSVF
jgi:hypothetical protein